VLSKFFWKINPIFIDGDPGFEKNTKDKNASVIIGDRTFKLNGTFPYEYDLAEEWFRFTGLPFVFAAWVSTEKLDEKFIKEFNAVLRHGVDFCFAAINESVNQLSISKEKAIEYLTKRIDYKLDDNKRKAMNLFLDYIKQL